MKKAREARFNVAEKANAPFPSRLRTLMEREQMKQKDLAALLNVTRQSINQYCLGLSTPDLDKLCKIATRFSVTADYLLGMTDVSSTNPTMKMACAFTGLSETAIAQLRTLNEDVYSSEKFPSVTPLATLSEMISQGNNFTYLMDYIMQGYEAYIQHCIQTEEEKAEKSTSSADNTTELRQAKDILEKHGYSCFSDFDISDLYFLQAMTAIKIICSDLGDQGQILIEEMRAKK